ncbi:MAG: orotate phosphoribosyltransferase [Cryomorphaceae bacterium]|nr:orotate phosphoribosyltransferase [Cryomorphaceae bacterium]
MKIISEDTARNTAHHLLKIQAIKLQPGVPFTWASGWKSPIYCDNRMTLSHPEVRTYIKNQVADAVAKLYPTTEVIAGVATGAIALGALVADALNIPFVYVRPEPKSHGRKNQIEGYLPKGKRVVVIEDLISTGKSSLLAVDALRKEEANVMGMLAIFTYQFVVAEQNFKEANCQIHTLSNYEHLIAEAAKQDYILESEMQTLENWRLAPENWGK